MAAESSQIWLPSQSSLNEALTDHQLFSLTEQQSRSSNQSFNPRYGSINPPPPPTVGLNGLAFSGYGLGGPQLAEPAQQSQANGFYPVWYQGNGFAGLLGKCSPGTGVFLPNISDLSKKTTTKNKSGTRNPKQQKVKEGPGRNLYKGRGNNVWTKQKKEEEYFHHHVYVASDSALPKEWSY